MFNPERPTLKARIARGDCIALTWLNLGSVALVEAAVRAKPDAIVLDLQHGLWERKELEAAIGIVPEHIPVIVRTAENSALAVGTALDAGAEGVMIPLIETAEDAKRAISYAKYPPHGIRSGGGVRPLMNFGAYVKGSKDIAVMLMIETAEGLANARAIAAYRGIDLVFIGTGDLALSLGTMDGDRAKHEAACAAIKKACDDVSLPCGIFTGSIQSAIDSRSKGYGMVVAANDTDVVVSGFAQANAALRDAPSAKTNNDFYSPNDTPTSNRNKAMSTNLIADFGAAIAGGSIRMVDLTHTLSEEFPALILPPEFGQVWAFKQEKISHYDEKGPGWYWNNFTMGEHTGTHFDAPVHWVTGKDHPNNTVDTINLKTFMAPAVVIDASAEVAKNEDYVLTVEFLQAWEAKHGKIPKGAWLLFRTDWSKRAMPDAYLNFKEDGPHTPGPAKETVEWLVKERDVLGFGVETINTDAGQSYAWPVAYPCHTLMHGANKYGLQCLTNLDQLPPTGAMIVAAPLKIKDGSGSPLRVMALIPA